MNNCYIKDTKNNSISLLHNKHHIISEILYNHITKKKKKNLNFINAILKNWKLKYLFYILIYAFQQQTFSSIVLRFLRFYETRWCTRNVSMRRVNATKLTWKLPISIYSHIQGLYMSLRAMVGIAIKCYVIINSNGR